MNARRLAYLAELGVPSYRLRRAPATAQGVNPATGMPATGMPATEIPAAGDDWAGLEREVAACTLCALHRGRTRTVFGVGRRDAPLLVVGEAPGAEEDLRGEPFVGPAGRMLNAMLNAIGWPREQVYIANIVKCRPPENRDPVAEEAAACSDYLDRQIALVRPRALLAVGRVSAQHLLRSARTVGSLRGVVHRYGDPGVPLVVTYHPAYLLRTPTAKAECWQDLCMLRPLLSHDKGPAED